jgi:hypothetical protein
MILEYAREHSLLLARLNVGSVFLIFYALTSQVHCEADRGIRWKSRPNQQAT